jgi:hypothetical protein
MRAILWPKDSTDGKPPPDGKTVRRRLFDFLSRQQRQAPKRGRGAYLRRFIEHVRKVTRSYAKGLFHCYDDPRIPQTTNHIEGLNGTGKRNLRRCAGRASTANGPGASYGAAYMFAVDLHAYLPLPDIDALLVEAIDPNRYREARRRLDEMRAPQARRRSFLRNPDKRLAEILANWRGP